MSKATDPLKLPNETAAEFFRRRAGEARPEDLREILALAPDRAPDAGDEMPASGRR